MVSAQLTGAEMVLQAFEDHKVDTLFGYPGGAVLPIYDELAKGKSSIHHYLVRHEPVSYTHLTLPTILLV